MSYAHGQYGQVKIVGFAMVGSSSSAHSVVTLCVKKWEGDLKKTKHDTSDTCTTDWQKFQVGKKVVEFTIEAQLDLANSPVGTGINLQADYAQVKLYADSTAGSPTFDIPVAIVDSIKITAMEGDIISYTITGSSSGTVTIA